MFTAIFAIVIAAVLIGMVLIVVSYDRNDHSTAALPAMRPIEPTFVTRDYSF